VVVSMYLLRLIKAEVCGFLGPNGAGKKAHEKTV